jgi:hypothetical protein
MTTSDMLAEQHRRMIGPPGPAWMKIDQLESDLAAVRLVLGRVLSRLQVVCLQAGADNEGDQELLSEMLKLLKIK